MADDGVLTAAAQVCGDPILSSRQSARVAPNAGMMPVCGGFFNTHFWGKPTGHPAGKPTALKHPRRHCLLL